MKRSTAPPKALLLAAVFLCAGILLPPRVCCGQGGQSWWGSSSWFDWSDYRAEFDLRVWLPRLTSGSLETSRGTFDFKGDLGFNDDPEPFRELYITAYIDRLGLRLVANEGQSIQGTDALGTLLQKVRPDLVTQLQQLGMSLSGVPELQVGGTRVGLDLDLIRHPMLRCGIDADYQKEKLTLQDTGEGVQLKGKQTVTTGFHATALPGRIRDIPVIFRGRARFPVPFVSSNLLNTKVTDWEVSAGLRPAIWEISHYGLSTFSVAVELGYRSMNLEFTDNTGPANASGTVKATIQGGFIQVGFVY